MKTKKLKSVFSFAVLSAITILLLGACNGDSSPGDAAPSSFLASSGSRDLNPEYTEADLELFVADNNAFALDLYHEISDEGENLFFSPYSISVAMAMTWAGAENQTESQIADVLHFNFPQEKLHSLFNELDLDLSTRDQGDPENDDMYLKLNISNNVWCQKDYTFLEAYLDTLMINYGAGIRLVDYMNDPEQARLDINDWVAEQTEDKIQDLLSPNDITNLTRLVLTNTIYFNASWGIPFDPDLTYNGDFYLENGTTVAVSMMIPEAAHGEFGEDYAAAEGPNYQAVQLPYYKDEFSMIIIVPDSGIFETIEQNLDSTFLNEIIDCLETRDVVLRMPKFEYESRFDLTETLYNMGMPDAFTGLADFSGITGTSNLSIAKVIHQASITLDESGTEAAAATAVIFWENAASNPLEITIDRPFIYMIRDNQTGAILFLGRVKNPG